MPAAKARCCCDRKRACLRRFGRFGRVPRAAVRPETNFPEPEQVRCPSSRRFPRRQNPSAARGLSGPRSSVARGCIAHRRSVLRSSVRPTARAGPGATPGEPSGALVAPVLPLIAFGQANEEDTLIGGPSLQHRKADKAGSAWPPARERPEVARAAARTCLPVSPLQRARSRRPPAGSPTASLVLACLPAVLQHGDRRGPEGVTRGSSAPRTRGARRRARPISQEWHQQQIFLHDHPRRATCDLR